MVVGCYCVLVVAHFGGYLSEMFGLEVWLYRLGRDGVLFGRWFWDWWFLKKISRASHNVYLIFTYVAVLEVR
jgi:hypothetical protein